MFIMFENNYVWKAEEIWMESAYKEFDNEYESKCDSTTISRYI